MKTSKRIFSILVLLIMLSVVFSNTCFAEDYSNDQYYDTKAFDVEITIDENNVYHVKETIKVEFTSPCHGIFRYIPIKSKISRVVNGKELVYPTKAKISKLKVDGYNFSKEYENGNVVVKTGDADSYVNGEQTYVVTYNYRPHDDRTSEYDEVYFNILPANCPTPIESANFTVNFPKSIDASKIAFYAGAYGDNDQSVVTYTVNDNKITGKINNSIPKNYGVTLRTELPEGYFKSQKTDTSKIILMWILILICPIAAFLLWMLFGRDETLIKPVTVMPPEGLTPADVGYIVDETAEHRDLLSLLFYWADRGYIIIEDGKKDDFILTKVKDLPLNSENYEKTIFNGLFKKGDVVATSSLKGKFFDKLSKAIIELQNKFTVRKNTRLYTFKSKVAQNLCLLFVAIPIVSVTIIGYMVNVVEVGFLVMTCILCFVLYLLYLFVFETIKKWNSTKKSSRSSTMVVLFILIIAISALLFLSGFKFLQADTLGEAKRHYLNTTMPMLVALIGSAVCTFFSTIMKKRTPRMNTLYGEILGLKEFIEYAEKDRIEMLIEENPHYFFNILPYAYVLGVSDKWAKKFESLAIEPPEWYRSSTPIGRFNTYMFINSMNRSMNNVQANLAIPPAPKGGGFNGGGGSGFSGGFSGGGGGGGGMGSW